MNINTELMNFLDDSLSVFHVVENMRQIFNEHDFKELEAGEAWDIEVGGKYFIAFNESSMIGFEVAQDPKGFNIVASHSDSPNFKVKPNAISSDGKYLKLNTEPYGGLIHHTWLDRPLGLAGRVLVRENGTLVSKLYDAEKAVAVIPSLAIHMNRGVNQGAVFNPQTQLVPIIGMGNEFSFNDMLASKLDVKAEDIVDFELNLFPIEGSSYVGINDEFISANRIDNLQCAFTSLRAFLDAEVKESINVYVCFDNEEIGSMTKQGAQSAILKDTLMRVIHALGYSDDKYLQLLNNTFMVSADNAHATHPNYPEKADSNHYVEINKGPVIKYNAAQKYTTDGVSGAIFRELASRVDEPVQSYVNRSDERGGGTLGSISSTQISIKSVDIGLPQLAMHSSMELTGSKDSLSLYNILREFYSVSFKITNKSISIN